VRVWCSICQGLLEKHDPLIRMRLAVYWARFKFYIRLD